MSLHLKTARVSGSPTTADTEATENRTTLGDGTEGNDEAHNQDTLTQDTGNLGTQFNSRARYETQHAGPSTGEREDFQGTSTAARSASEDNPEPASFHGQTFYLLNQPDLRCTNCTSPVNPANVAQSTRMESLPSPQEHEHLVQPHDQYQNQHQQQILPPPPQQQQNQQNQIQPPQQLHPQNSLLQDQRMDPVSLALVQQQDNASQEFQNQPEMLQQQFLLRWVVEQQRDYIEMLEREVQQVNIERQADRQQLQNYQPQVDQLQQQVARLQNQLIPHQANQTYFMENGAWFYRPSMQCIRDNDFVFGRGSGADRLPGKLALQRLCRECASRNPRPTNLEIRNELIRSVNDSGGRFWLQEDHRLVGPVGPENREVRTRIGRAVSSWLR